MPTERDVPCHDYLGYTVAIHPPRRSEMVCRFTISRRRENMHPLTTVTVHEGVGIKGADEREARHNSQAAAHEWIDMHPMA